MSRGCSTGTSAECDPSQHRWLSVWLCCLIRNQKLYIVIQQGLDLGYENVLGAVACDVLEGEEASMKGSLIPAGF